MTISTVLFDLDGTLRDTRVAIYEACRHAVRHHGGPDLTNEELAQHIHHHSHVHEAYAAHVSLAEFETILNGRLYELLPEVHLYEQTVETLTLLRGEGRRLGVVSSAAPAELGRFLDSAGISGLFEVIIGDDGSRPRKPAPDPILAALEALEAPAGSAVMVGDTHVDIESGLQAGLPVVVGVTHGFQDRERLERANATHIIDSLWELPPLLERIEH